MLVLGVTEIVGKLSTLLVVVGAARFLGVEDFGVFAYSLAVGALAAVIPLWGYDAIVVQRASAEPARLPGLLAGLLAMRTLLAAAVFGALCMLLGLSWHSGPESVAAGLLIIAAVMLDTYTEAFRSAAAAMQHQSIIAVVHLTQRLLTAAGALAALLADTGLLGLAVAYCLGTAVGPPAAALLVRARGVRPDWTAVSVASLVQLNRGTWMLGLTSIIAMALFRLDMVFLEALSGHREVAIYAASYRLLESAVFVCWVVTRALFPLMAADPEPRRVQRYTEQGFGVLAAVFIPYMTVMLCRGRDVLSLLFGERFADAGTDMLRWLAPAPLLFGMGYLIAYGMMAAGPNLRLLIGPIAALVVSVVLNILLIPYYGGIAAAFTTSVCYAVEAAISLRLARGLIGRPRLLRTALPALVASALAAGVLLAPWPFLAALPAGVTLYLSGWLIIARRTDPEQVRVLRGMLTPGRVS
ncbi:oligosaccharide flippase family protein [Streptomyces sp. NBC_00028]|uniref:oligosaccharide flippase family protein n=1 Tax=Streptomyces sp. NBC_00028 TaxID=2975624 RepID=UPI00324B3C00